MNSFSGNGKPFQTAQIIDTRAHINNAWTWTEFDKTDRIVRTDDKG